MYPNNITIKLIIFSILFSTVFYGIRYFNILPNVPTNYIPWLFSAISLIFSIISGFVIQSKWQTWNELIDSTHGEVSSIKQLHMLANHFPRSIQDTIRSHIHTYLELIIEESNLQPTENNRSKTVEVALYELEETVLDIDYREHPNIGALSFDLVRKCLDYREKRLQNVSHKLPHGVKLFTINATIAVIVSSLFIGEDVRTYDYFLTLIMALLSYGIYLLIDDLDNPYRPGQWHLKNDEYVGLYQEVGEYLGNPEKHQEVYKK